VTDLPPDVARIVDELARLPGAIAVVLGGSRARTPVEASRDWELGLYYLSTIDLAPLATRGTVYPPGSWGRLMNGGAWLRCGAHTVDVLLRDTEVVQDWTRRAIDGEFEVDSLLGYLAGIPTYTLTAELASYRPLRGDPPAAIPYPEALAASAGLTAVQSMFGRTPDPSGLVQWVDVVAQRLGAQAESPWTDAGRKA
jgi:hypothetical protein